MNQKIEDVIAGNPQPAYPVIEGEGEEANDPQVA